MLKKLLLSLGFVLILQVNEILATPQIPDILVYQGKEYPLQYAMLEPYLKKFPERNPRDEESVCSALWRGYQARFEVSDGKVYLKDVLINVCFGPVTSQLKKVVPDGKPLFIDWVTDLLNSGYGENLEDPYGLASLDAYEKYSFFQVEKGRILKVRHFDNKEYKTFKKKQFEAYKKTEAFDETSRKILENNPKMNKSDVDAHIEQWIFSYSKTFLVN